MFGACLLFLAALSNSANSLSFVPSNEQKLDLQIALDNGVIQGKRMYTEEKKIPFYAYQGIPYAKPPVGKLRFASPVPPEKWEGVLRTTYDAPTCTQDTEQIVYVGSEDCLYLNVYTTQKIEESKNITAQPVIVFFYGGGFKFGSSNHSTYGPDYLLEQGILVVSFNYRVGVFGFLSTGDSAAPGNFGLKDQIYALKWVQRNIKYFGGNPNIVTLFGESAGAASVSYLMLSPAAKGLFHRAISSSGSALCPWAMSKNPVEITYAVAAAAGVFARNNKDLVKKLRKLDYRWLHFAERSAMVLDSLDPLNGLAFAPTIEPNHPDAVITEGPHKLLQSSSLESVPFMSGFNSLEAAVFQYVLDFVRPLLVNFEMPQRLIPTDMNIPTLHPDEVVVGNQIRWFYFGLQPLPTANKTQILHFISDNQFLKGILEEVKLRAKKAPTYVYQFSYQGELGSFLDNQARQVKGVAHSEELWYIWKNKDQQSSHKDDINVRKMFVKLLSNFAKTGNPTPIKDQELHDIVWPTALDTDGNLKYLDVDTKLKIRQNPRREAMDFWRDLYKDYGRPPFTTY